MTGARALDAAERARDLAWVALHGPLQGRFPFRSPQVIERAQRRRLAATVAHAHRHVPHYRETMDRIGLTPGDLTTVADLARLPMIERADVQRDPERFVSRARPIERHMRMVTAGSTGAPISIYRDASSLLRWRGAYHQRAGAIHRRAAGRRRGLRTLGVEHPPGPNTPTGQAGLSALLRLVGARHSRVSLFDPLEHTVEELNRFRPDMLVSHGSYLEALFAHLDASGARFHRPRVVVYGGDGMSASARALVSEGFGIPVLGVYGAYETTSLGFECPESLGYHLNADLNPVRIVDADGREVADGETGEVVVSNLVNRATILLNYRLGDLASKLARECPCGRSLPLLSYVQGRTDEWLRSASGEPVHSQIVYAGLDFERDVIRYQALQRAPGRVELKLVARPGADREAIQSRARARYVDKLSAPLEFDFAFVEDLPRTARGKTRTVIGLPR